MVRWFDGLIVGWLFSFFVIPSEARDLKKKLTKDRSLASLGMKKKQTTCPPFRTGKINNKTNFPMVERAYKSFRRRGRI